MPQPVCWVAHGADSTRAPLVEQAGHADFVTVLTEPRNSGSVAAYGKALRFIVEQGWLEGGLRVEASFQSGVVRRVAPAHVAPAQAAVVCDPLRVVWATW